MLYLLCYAAVLINFTYYAHVKDLYLGIKYFWTVLLEYIHFYKIKMLTVLLGYIYFQK